MLLIEINGKWAFKVWGLTLLHPLAVVLQPGHLFLEWHSHGFFIIMGCIHNGRNWHRRGGGHINFLLEGVSAVVQASAASVLIFFSPCRLIFLVSEEWERVFVWERCSFPDVQRIHPLLGVILTWVLAWLSYGGLTD